MKISVKLNPKWKIFENKKLLSQASFLKSGGLIALNPVDDILKETHKFPPFNYFPTITKIEAYFQKRTLSFGMKCYTWNLCNIQAVKSNRLYNLPLDTENKKDI